MAVRARYYTDPACSVSWANEPVLRKLMVEFGADVDFTYVMGGLRREYKGDLSEYVRYWLSASGRSGMPVDPLLWFESPIASSYPACMAVKAATEQAGDGGYRFLRALREGLLCFRRKLDTTEALVEEARGAGLDAERFRIDLGSHAIVEAFGADLDLTRSPPAEARERGGSKRIDPPLRGAGAGERLSFPSGCFTGEDGSEHWVFGLRPYEAWREAALAAGAMPAGGEPPGVLGALSRFGRMAAVEVGAVCELPGARAEAELWRLAADWKLSPVPVLAGWLFEAA
jgi:predicted DsbA family dithiol-disulfide isomerase